MRLVIVTMFSCFVVSLVYALVAMLPNVLVFGIVLIPALMVICIELAIAINTKGINKNICN